MVGIPSEYCHSLLEVVRAINSSLSLPQSLTRIVTTTAQAMGAKACSIRLLSTIDQTLTIRAAHGLSANYLAKGPVQVSRSAADRQALGGQVVFIEDVANDRRVQYPQEMAREGIRSVLLAPLVARGTSVGVIRIYSAEPRHFEQQEQDFLRIIAEMAAVSIDNARVHDTLLAELKSLRQRVHDMEAAARA